MPKASFLMARCLVSIAFHHIIFALLASVEAQEKFPPPSYGGNYLPSPSADFNYDEPYMPSYRNTYSYYSKRFVPHWYHSLGGERDYNRYVSPIAEMKRFIPFHPLARFRGLTVGSGGGSSGGAPGGAYLPSTFPMRHRLNFDTYISSEPHISPGHPVPSDGKSISMEEEEEERIPTEDILNDESRPEIGSKSGGKMRAGDILKFLDSMASPQYGVNGKVKAFQFGIK